MSRLTRVFLLALTPFVLIAGSVEEDQALFVDEVYPIFERAQCRLCHDDNGIATATRVQFPPEQASSARLLQFGYALRPVVDAANPGESLLLTKPTQKVPHTGGQRIALGSADAATLGRWVQALAGISAEQARGRIAQLGGASESSSGSVRRLTHAQYNNTVRDLLGSETRPAANFPPEDYVDGFSNQISAQAASPILTEAYNGAARKLARAAFLAGDSHGLIPCEPSGPGDPACRDEFLREFGRRAFRRRLSEPELTSYGALFSAAARQDRAFSSGAQVVIEAMLQSPNFLFYGHEDSRDHRIASRLAYFLWNTTPDESLLEAADNGQLNSSAAVEKIARKMLADPRAQDSVDDFLAQWMRFDRLLLAVRDSRIYPEFSVELAASMAEETRTVFRDIVWGGKDFNTFFTADYSFVDQELAKIYGVTPPAEPFGQVQLPASAGRGGILGQASFLTVTSKPGESSPTERGKFIREQFLCQIMPPPPAGVSTQLPLVTDEMPLNNRQQLSIHLSNESCANCHRLIDPIGFGLEHYDAIGKFRETQTVEIRPTVDEQRTKRKTEATEYLLPIDTTAYIQGIENSEFATPREAGQVLASDPVCRRCTVKQLFRYALGRHETEADQTSIDQVFQQFEGSQFDFRELIIAIAVSEPFVGADQ
ncbi:MAG: DUF1592 domain-containing protein [Acidobacteria bacterium]|nr:DUF1592 domain-containing protein [Acidobacteriota bacterium]MDA1235672.1 DUF1592 domain-containing protein [Acidobacteriota bacterium]